MWFERWQETVVPLRAEKPVQTKTSERTGQCAAERSVRRRFHPVTQKQLPSSPRYTHSTPLI